MKSIKQKSYSGSGIQENIMRGNRLRLIQQQKEIEKEGIRLYLIKNVEYLKERYEYQKEKYLDLKKNIINFYNNIEKETKQIEKINFKQKNNLINILKKNKKSKELKIKLIDDLLLSYNYFNNIFYKNIIKDIENIENIKINDYLDLDIFKTNNILLELNLAKFARIVAIFNRKKFFIDILTKKDDYYDENDYYYDDDKINENRESIQINHYEKIADDAFEKLYNVLDKAIKSNTINKKYLQTFQNEIKKNNKLAEKDKKYNDKMYKEINKYKNLINMKDILSNMKEFIRIHNSPATAAGGKSLKN